MSFTPLPNINDFPTLGNPLEDAKRAAAYRAVDENLNFDEHRIIGVGSGSTVVYVAERIGQYLKDEKYHDKVSKFICIPTGYQSRNLIQDNGLILGSIEQHPHVDIAFDGADEVDHNLQLIKGGGACLFQEKLVSTSAKIFIVVADSRKKSDTNLGINWKRGVPIEIVPSAWSRVQHDLTSILHANSAPVRQGGSAKAGPVVTDNMNFLIDADFGEIQDPKALHEQIKMLVGVVETGLFIDSAHRAYFGKPDGSVEVIDKK
ncbi:Ribose-5-phosphate isomerase [Nakaseomyces glabratus]|nr:Ribose-5-phosphate isomerase [Nakaseomyces glabratus]KTB24639.1 Ribose-5-phosphate isomerase [Nakaseomyces glabratus]